MLEDQADCDVYLYFCRTAMGQFDLSIILYTSVRDMFGLSLDRTVHYRISDHSLQPETGHDTHQLLPISICQNPFPHNQSEYIPSISEYYTPTNAQIIYYTLV